MIRSDHILIGVLVVLLLITTAGLIINALSFTKNLNTIEQSTSFNFVEGAKYWIATENGPHEYTYVLTKNVADGTAGGNWFTHDVGIYEFHPPLDDDQDHYLTIISNNFILENYVNCNEGKCTVVDKPTSYVF